MKFSHFIAVSNCPLQQWSTTPEALTYTTSHALGFGGTFSCTNKSFMAGKTESQNPAYPRSGFTTSVRWKANCSFSLWLERIAGYPLNEDLNEESVFFVHD
jgi:hypothetical protein